MRSILLAVAMLFSTGAMATEFNPAMEILKAQGLLNNEVQPLGLEWTVGDSTDHNINMGFISGSMHSSVRQETSQGFWMDQDMDLGFFGKQKVEIHINKNTGEIIEMIVNGEKQNPPEQGEQEVVDMKEDKVKVPAGTFDCVYLRIKDKSNNQESQAWLNPQEVPMMGLLKTIQPGQFGEVVVELTKFKKN